MAAETGVSTIELLATLGIVALLIGLGVSSFSGRLVALSSATDSLASGLRMARANAASRGTHYRVTINTNSFSTERLQSNGGGWTPTGNRLDVEFPDPAYVSTGAGTVVDFDTRGLVVPPSPTTPASLVTFQLTNSETGKSKTLQVWPSGQIRRG